jgi:phosphoribosyl 1,2-cyclic phosphodiesterase
MVEITIIASGSSGNCYLIRSGQSQLLIEAGITFPKIQKAVNFQVSQLDGCLISHCHL